MEDNYHREAVRRGAKLLDKLIPGWHQRMRPEQLRMSNASLCAAGQLFGNRVEMAIAKEMYPEEHREAVVQCNRNSWASQSRFAGWELAFGGGLVQKIIDKVFRTARARAKAEA